MSAKYHIYIWKQAPFIRLLLPLIIGILFQYYLSVPLKVMGVGFIILLILFGSFKMLPQALRFQFRFLQGMVISVFIFLTAIFITWQKDIRNHQNWYGNFKNSNFIIVKLREPPVEKARTYKALASVENVIHNGRKVQTTGKILIYFSKDSAASRLNFGDRLLLINHLQPIKNSGNPAAFDYRRYCSLQQIYQQTFIRQDQWLLLKNNDQKNIRGLIFSTREYILKSLKKYIPGNYQSSIAKALLIGYRIDLDKDLVQAYSNVGVVHLIAISGMHLALIYVFLLWLFSRIPVIKKSAITRLILVICCLWFFSFLTGAPASVLRAAVMFTFIAIGTYFQKQNSIYNSLAISAFLLLCLDPFMLWDVGFQLSYLAVLGIVICHRNIFHWLYFRNKFLNEAWKLASVSLAAQVFTIPLCIFYFHQFPLMFLLSNMIAIPLSTAALWGSLLVVALSPFPAAALFFGKLVMIVIWLLNNFIRLIDHIPFGVWTGLSITTVETILLYFIFSFLLFWLFRKNLPALRAALIFSIMLLSNQVIKKYKINNQKKIIVYNISHHQAIDFINGKDFIFLADEDLKEDNLLMNYNVKPARTLFSANQDRRSMPGFFKKNNFYQFYGARLLLVDSSVKYIPGVQKIKVDYILISKNAGIRITDLAANFDCQKYIFDASNSVWKIEKWKKECEELHLRSHSVSEQGAFVTDL